MEAAPRERNMALGVRIRTAAATMMDGIAPVYRLKRALNTETKAQWNTARGWRLKKP